MGRCDNAALYFADRAVGVSDYDLSDSSLFSSSPNAMLICKPKTFCRSTKSLGLSWVVSLDLCKSG